MKTLPPFQYSITQEQELYRESLFKRNPRKDKNSKRKFVPPLSIEQRKQLEQELKSA